MRSARRPGCTLATLRPELAWRPDEPVVTASVFKVAVLVELHRQAAAGRVDLSTRVRVTDADRVFGPTGLSVFADDAELSLRDLATLMVSVSDNTATDLVLRAVGSSGRSARTARASRWHHPVRQ